MSEFDLLKMQRVIALRKQNPTESYTSKLFTDKKGATNKICEKIGEETSEVILAAKDNQGLVEEMADLWYFCTALLTEKGINVQDVIKELERRNKNG